MAFLWWLLKQYYPHFQHQTTQFKELIISGLIQRNKTDDIIIWAINTYPFFFSSKCPATISIKYVKINSFVNFPDRGDSFPFSLYFDFFPSSPSPALPLSLFPAHATQYCTFNYFERRDPASVIKAIATGIVARFRNEHQERGEYRV